MSKQHKRGEQGGVARKRTNTALNALASGALALPGLSNTALADAPADRAEMNYRFSYYLEDDLPAHRISGGTADSERYEIMAHQLHYGTPWGERMDLDFNFIYETMSGASPIRVEDVGVGMQTVMSGATIEEERIDFSGTTNYYFDSGRAGATMGISDEKDYFSFSIGADGEKHINDKSTTLLGGVLMSFDEISSTVGGSNPNPKVKDEKQGYTAFVGAAQILSKSAVLQATATYKYSTGYLSDPYKQFTFAGGGVPDSRPDTRNQLAILVRSRTHFEQVNGTLHGDFQYSFDDWGINAGAIEIAWHQSVFELFKLVPQFRYYTQSEADFYDTTFGGLAAPSIATSDYRLSPYGALSYGFKAQMKFRGMWKSDWETAISYERYISDADLALGKVKVENPALVASHLVSFRLTGRF